MEDWTTWREVCQPTRLMRSGSIPVLSPGGAAFNSQGRQPLVRIGVGFVEPQRGERFDLPPLRGSTIPIPHRIQGLAPLAIECRPSGAKAKSFDGAFGRPY